MSPPSHRTGDTARQLSNRVSCPSRPATGTLARVATALDRHLVVSFPEKVPAKLEDAVQVA